ncbi:hypothetical protein HY638_04335 [Candidatus Woesearchaeota archaeon]|nr:hypothetical protein [Candidatus Woesearchaeota archaeon]
MKQTCPKCGSSNITFSVYDGAQIVTCNECSYDESQDLEVYPEERGTQREKARQSPYKRGGHSRSAGKRKTP